MKNPTFVQIDLEAARNCDPEEVHIHAILDQECFEERNRMSLQELLRNTNIRSALPLLRFARVNNPAFYCRSVSAAMAQRALEENRAHITHYDTYIQILDSIHDYTPEQLKRYFKLLKAWALDRDDADKTCLIDSINSCAAALVCEVIAPLDYEVIVDLNECALETPINTFANWVELSTSCDPTLNALSEICMAAQRAEQKWCIGTGLNFDFMTDAIKINYPAAYKATHGLTNDCTEHTAEEVLLSVSLQG